MKKILCVDLGCGRNKKTGYIGVDKSEYSDADYILDIGKDMLPFDDESISIIYSAHTLEHLNGEELIHVMNESWRVLSWGGQMFAHVPQLSSVTAWQDCTHKSYFVKDSIKFFCGDYLIKYRLDYGIDCAFVNYETLRYYPNGDDEESKKYCTMLQFSLRKDKSHWRKVSKFFPFGTHPPPDSYAEYKPKIFDPHKEARKGELVGGVNYALRFLRKELGVSSGTTDYYCDPHMSKFKDHTNEMCYRAFHEHVDKMIKIKADATKRYGSDPAPLGTKGLFADLNRKFTRIRRFFWDEVQDAGEENIMDTCYDMAVYSILMAMEFTERSKDE